MNLEGDVTGRAEEVGYGVDHRGTLELFVTISAEATNPNHPAREFVQRRYADVVRNWSAKLPEAVARGEVGVLTDEQIEAEIRILVAVLDGVELQWLLQPHRPEPGVRLLQSRHPLIP